MRIRSDIALFRIFGGDCFSTPPSGTLTIGNRRMFANVEPNCDIHQRKLNILTKIPYYAVFFFKRDFLQWRLLFGVTQENMFPDFYQEIQKYYMN